MDYGKTASGKLPGIISALKDTYTVYAPVSGNEVTFSAVDDPSSVTLEYSNFKLSPKSAFFPKTEKLFSMTDTGAEDAFREPEAFVLFGVRPCDVQSFTLLDLVFAQENGGFADPYYTGRRKKGTVISYACSAPCGSCFCTSFDNGGPASEEGSDILLYKLEDTLLFKGVSDKGRDLLEKLSGVLDAADEGDLQKAEALKLESEKLIQAVDTSQTPGKVKGNFYDSLWKGISEKCVGCGICTFLCPTCHCFDVTDEKKKDRIDRIRVWDSCQFSMFTLHASGHNPRPSQTERMRQRVLHKFSYTVKNFGRIFCVGCGRCVRSCPVNLDIRETVKSLNTLTPKEGGESQ